MKKKYEVELYFPTFPLRALVVSLVRNQCSVLNSVSWIRLRLAQSAVKAAGTANRVSGRWMKSALRPLNLCPLICVGYHWKAEMVIYGHVSRMVPLLEKSHKEKIFQIFSC